MPRVAGILLAAGRSRRFTGGCKQLLDFRGEPLVRRAARTALASRLSEVVAVTGHAAGAVGGALAGLGLRLVENPDFAQGKSTSIRAGLAALAPAIDAALFLPADQPLLRTASIDRLLDAFAETGGPIVTAACGERRGAPVLFHRSLFAELERLAGDTGGRRLLPRHTGEVISVQVDRPEELADIDTEEDARRLLELAPGWRQSPPALVDPVE